nr:MAG TPA: hypothetical protein [Caudoviricetes sp.]
MYILKLFFLICICRVCDIFNGRLSLPTTRSY